jgi:GIY-YIG catalytic domain.
MDFIHIHGKRNHEISQTIQTNRQKHQHRAKNKQQINNIIGNSIENHNKFEKRGMYKLTCNSCNKFYIGRTKRNFKTRFNEHRRDFITSTGNSTFSEHILNAEHEMWPMEETMTILHFENDHF